MNKKASFLFEIEQLMQTAFDRKALDKDGYLYFKNFLDSHKLICGELLVEDVRNNNYTPRINRILQKIKFILDQGINDSKKISHKLLGWLPSYKIIDSNEIMSVLNDLSIAIVEDLIKANNVNKKRKPDTDDSEEDFPNRKLVRGNSYKNYYSGRSTVEKLLENGHQKSNKNENSQQITLTHQSQNSSEQPEFFIAKEEDSAQNLGNADYGSLETDVPLKIISHVLNNDQEPSTGNVKNLAFQLEWQTRSDNLKPKSSYYSYDRLRENYSHLILQYFENVIQLE